jgi:Protein of unknown function (DUF669)
VAKEKIDFSGVPEDIKKGSGKSAHVPEGDYAVKIAGVESRESNAGSKYFSWKFVINQGPQKGKTVYGSTSLKPEALWSLRNLIHAATGKNVAGKVVGFDPDNLIGKIVGAAIEDNEYRKDGKTVLKSQVSTCFPIDELEEADEEEEEEEDDEEVEDEDDDDLEDVEVDDI